MIEDPRELIAGVRKKINSSEMRERWLIINAPAAVNSMTKSRSETASREFSEGAVNPSALAVKVRSIG